MKNYSLLITICCLIGVAAQSQNIEVNDTINTPNAGQDPCNRTQIVTNPFAPQNTEWYTMRNRFNWMDYVTQFGTSRGRIRYFDHNNFYGQGQQEHYFINPYFDNEPYLSHINLKGNLNLKLFLNLQTDFSNIHRLAEEMDITNVEHGWELLWKSDGYEADGITPINGSLAQFGSAANFMLYNRYTGMLRWFTAPRVTNYVSFNELEPVITFADGNVASLFRNYNNLDQALDKPTQVLRVATPAKTSSSEIHLSMADFNISYDPCVCYFDSRLAYSLNGNTTANINLYGRLEGTAQMLSASDAINSDRLLSIYKDNEFQSMVKNGLLEYKNYGQMVKDFKELDQKSNIFDDAYDASKIVAEIAELGLTNVDPTKLAYKKLKIASKFLGFASMPFKTDKGTKSPPMLIQAQMTLTGQLNSTVELNGLGFEIYTPGSFNTSSSLIALNNPLNGERFLYPIYNQALGLYALLKTPKKEVGMNQTEATITGVLVVPTYDNMGRENGTRLIDSTTRSFVYQPRIAYKLKEDIAFTFNPSAQINFNATQMEAAWMIEVENDPSALHPLHGGGIWLFSSPNMKKTYSYKNEQNKTITVYASEFFPLECIAQFVPVFDYALSPGSIRPVFVKNPIERSLSSRLTSHVSRYNFARPLIVKTYLKINNLYRYNKPDGTGLNNIVHFETYKYEIEGNDNNASLVNSPNIAALSAPAEIVIENMEYTTSQNIFAWEKITIKGYVKTSNGAQVTIRSAGEIIVEPEAAIDPEIILEIGKPTVCNPTRIQPTVVDRSYCTDAAKYKGNTTLAKQAPNPEEAIDKIDKDAQYKQSLQVGLYPNPANSAFEVYTNAIGDYTISMIDITGRLVYTSEIVQNNKGIIDVSQLQNGIYFVQVNGNGHTTTQKIIVRH
jgi:hypothetical protein